MLALNEVPHLPPSTSITVATEAGAVHTTVA
jgi:hypothetical protein